ncbi:MULTISPECIES: hypothetical protein [unclassified Rhizobium]|uniref:hypothetical protein n=1 Tax=unclassified Rhizobium TaxID=2613769 RepID=UPI0007154F2B|nr:MULTISPECIES: hypothetical protein [unclassified Rhizobium]KQT04717.1 hypothetical protein ASG50_15740 [Rhizobium sp. Leaf386]KQT05083.1 hypothetical protein ASG42_21390 [Rhizobium sp. Leaf391]KQU02070.1 hypothetical protein ASG68_27905 [Rhizobium sp. Leaf453]
MREYLTSTEKIELSESDLMIMESVFEKLKLETVYRGNPENVRRLARSIIALYKSVARDPEKLVQILAFENRD